MTEGERVRLPGNIQNPPSKHQRISNNQRPKRILEFGISLNVGGWYLAIHFFRHFTTPAGKISVRHYRYFFTISQKKAGKRYFGAKKILNHG